MTRVAASGYLEFFYEQMEQDFGYIEGCGGIEEDYGFIDGWDEL